MSKKLNNQSGFGLIEGLLILVILSGLAFMGWTVYQNSDKAAEKGGNSTTPASNNQSDNTTPSSIDSDTAGWKQFEQPNEYKVKLVDGWIYGTIGTALHVVCNGGSADGCTYKPGTEAVVKSLPPTDGFSGLHIYTGEEAMNIYDANQKEWDSVGIFEAANSTGTKYLDTITEELALGPSKGTKIYSYVFGDNPKRVLVSWEAEPGLSDKLSLVEKMLKTLELI